MAIDLGSIFASLDADLKPLMTKLAKARAELAKFESKRTFAPVSATTKQATADLKARQKALAKEKAAVSGIVNSRKTEKSLLQSNLQDRRQSLAVEKASLANVTASRRAERKILQSQLKTSAAQQALSVGQGDALKRRVFDLQSQANLKSKLLAFDQQTNALEMSRLQNMRGVTAAQKARLAGQIRARQIAMQDLAIQQKMVKAQTAVGLQRARASARQSAEFAKQGAKGFLQRGATAVTGRVGGGISELGALVGLGGLSTGALIGAAAVASVAALGVAAVRASEKLRVLKLSMEAAAGGAKEGAQAFNFARSLAQQLGLDLVSTAEQYKNVLAATLAGGASAESAQFIFEGLAVGIRALGLEAEPAKRVMTAVGQIMSKGKIQAEELRQQLGEHLPVAMGFLAQGLGVGTAELSKMMERGELTSEAMLNLSAQFQKTMGGKVHEQTQSLTSQFQRLKNSTFELLASMGQGGLTMVGLAVINMLRSLVEVVKVLMPLIKGTFAVIGGGITVFATFVRTIAGVITGFVSMIGAAGQLAVGLTPIRIVVDFISAGFQKLGEIGNAVFGFLSDKISKFAGFIGSILPESFKKVLSAGKEGFKQGFFGEKIEEYKPKTSEELDKMVAELKKTFPTGKGGKSKSQQKAEFQEAVQQAKAITQERTAEKNLLQQQNSLQQVKNDLITGERDTIAKTMASLEAQKQAKLSVLQFDRETLNMELQKLQAIKGGTAAQMVKVQGEIASRQAKLEELAISEQIVDAEHRLSVQKAQQLAATKAIQEASQHAISMANIQADIATEKLIQRGARQSEIDQAHLDADRRVLELQMQKLQAELAMAEARGANTLGLQREIDLLQQSMTLLDAEQMTFDMTPMLEQAREYAGILTNGLRTFLDGITSGSLNFGDFFSDLGQNLIQTSIQPLFDSIQQQLTETFSGLGNTFGGFGGALFGGILAGMSTLFNHQKAETQSLADEVKGNIEETEAVRGLIAGDKSIATQQLSQNLAAAFRPTNDILRNIDSHIVQMLTALGETVTSTSGRYGDAISLSVLGAPRI